MSNLQSKLIDRELRKLSSLKEFNHQRYVEVAEMLIDMNLDDADFCKYMGRLKEIRTKYREKIE